MCVPGAWKIKGYFMTMNVQRGSKFDVERSMFNVHLIHSIKAI
jgi:hypothetical protein